MDDTINGIPVVTGKSGEPIIPQWGVTASENQFCVRIAAGEDPRKIIRDLFPEYDDQSSRKKNLWVKTTANRWLNSARITNRLAVIYEERRRTAVVTQKGMTEALSQIVAFDIGELFKEGENGEDVVKSLKEMTKDQRRMIKGFDKNGMPVLIDKEFAIKQIIKINGLEQMNVNVQIGGKLGELLGGGAIPRQKPIEGTRISTENGEAIDFEEINPDTVNL